MRRWSLHTWLLLQILRRVASGRPVRPTPEQLRCFTSPPPPGPSWSRAGPFVGPRVRIGIDRGSSCKLCISRRLPRVALPHDLPALHRCLAGIPLVSGPLPIQTRTLTIHHRSSTEMTGEQRLGAHAGRDPGPLEEPPRSTPRRHTHTHMRTRENPRKVLPETSIAWFWFSMQRRSDGNRPRCPDEAAEFLRGPGGRDGPGPLDAGRDEGRRQDQGPGVEPGCGPGKA